MLIANMNAVVLGGRSWASDGFIRDPGQPPNEKEMSDDETP